MHVVPVAEVRAALERVVFGYMEFAEVEEHAAGIRRRREVRTQWRDGGMKNVRDNGVRLGRGMDQIQKT